MTRRWPVVVVDRVVLDATIVPERDRAWSPAEKGGKLNSGRTAWSHR
jgi:hypothetical protein